MSQRDKALDLISEGLGILQTQQEDPSKSPVSVMAEVVVPGVKLHASKSRRGPWWYYLVMPEGWVPDDSIRGRWIYNHTAPNRYWSTGSGDTKKAALLAGLRQLLEVL